MPRDRLECKVYVGELGHDGNQHDLEEAFSYYGPLRNVWVARQPPGFAFIEFEDPRDAQDAVKGLNGRTVCGRRITAEMSTGKQRGPVRGRRGSRERDQGCFNCGSYDHYARDCSRRFRRRLCGASDVGIAAHISPHTSLCAAHCSLTPISAAVG